MANTLSPELKEAILTALTEKKDVTYEVYADTGREIKTITYTEACSLIPVFIEETVTDLSEKFAIFSKKIDGIIEKIDLASKLLN